MFPDPWTESPITQRSEIDREPVHSLICYQFSGIYIHQQNFGNASFISTLILPGFKSIRRFFWLSRSE